MFWYVHRNEATVRLDCDLFHLFERNLRSLLLLRSRLMISHMKNTCDRTSTTVRTGSENAAAQLQYSIQAAVREMSQRSPLKGGETGYLLWNRAHQRMTFLKLETKRHWHVMSFTKKDITPYFRIQTSHNVGPCQLSVNIFLSIKSNSFTFFVDSQL